jgi:hypothetical protein
MRCPSCPHARHSRRCPTVSCVCVMPSQRPGPRPREVQAPVLPADVREAWVSAQTARVQKLATMHVVEVQDLLRAAWDEGYLWSTRR